MLRKSSELVALLAAVVLFGLIAGCNGSNAQVSTDYKKLPPGEGERRLKETLKRRAAGQHLDHLPPADVRVSGN